MNLIADKLEALLKGQERSISLIQIIGEIRRLSNRLENVYGLLEDERNLRLKAELEIQELKKETNLGEVRSTDFDDFVGTVIGTYRTREGKEGVVLQQIGTRIVHVYRFDRTSLHYINKYPPEEKK